MDTETKCYGHGIPWNKGKLLGQKPPLKVKEVWAIRIRLQLIHRLRELVLFNLAISMRPTMQRLERTVESRDAVTRRPDLEIKTAPASGCRGDPS